MPDPAAFVVDVARLTLWLALLAVLLVPLERWFAVHDQRRTRRETATDVGLYFANSLVPAVLLAPPLALATAAAHRVLPAGWTGAVAALPAWLAAITAFVLAEAGFYWGHRWSHEWRWLWRFHRVHHAPRSLDWLVNTRAHPVDIVFTRLCGLAPLAALGLAPPGAAGGLIATLTVLAGTLWGFVIHANLRWRFGPLEQVLATPRFHHWHHVRTGAINRNYAAMLPVMDRVFATLHLPRREWPAEYGIDHAAEAAAQPSAQNTAPIAR